MNIECIVVGPFEVNSYILFLSSPGNALVVDPGSDAEDLLDFLRTNRLQPLAYLLTHGHADHTGALARLHRALPAPVALHPLDARWAFTEVSQIPPYYSVPEAPSEIQRALSDGQEWRDGPFHYRVIATPGHSPGGVSFYFPDDGLLFPGDTLFQGSAGRTDIPGGDSRALARSLARLAELPDTTRVFPGHGPATTIGAEKQTNFFLRNAAS